MKFIVAVIRVKVLPEPVGDSANIILEELLLLLLLLLLLFEGPCCSVKAFIKHVKSSD